MRINSVLLDTGVLGLITNPSNKPDPAKCKRWLGDRLRDGCRLYIPEITDYELRRKLIHMNFTTTIARLDTLKTQIEYLPITTKAMIKAAELWAWARRRGIPTASDSSLDADVILAAQAVTGPGGVVATSNTRHLNRFVTAKDWQDTW